MFQSENGNRMKNYLLSLVDPVTLSYVSGLALFVGTLATLWSTVYLWPFGRGNWARAVGVIPCLLLVLLGISIR